MKDKADEKLVDAEANVEEESTTKGSEVVTVENEVEVEEWNDSQDIPESTTTEVEEAVVLDDDVATEDEGDGPTIYSDIENSIAVGADVGGAVETDQEESVIVTNEASVVPGNEVGAAEKVDVTAFLENESEASEESLIVDYEVEAHDEISCELACTRE